MLGRRASAALTLEGARAARTAREKRRIARISQRTTWRDPSPASTVSSPATCLRSRSLGKPCPHLLAVQRARQPFPLSSEKNDGAIGPCAANSAPGPPRMALDLSGQRLKGIGPLCRSLRHGLEVVDRLAEHLARWSRCQLGNRGPTGVMHDRAI